MNFSKKGLLALLLALMLVLTFALGSCGEAEDVDNDDEVEDADDDEGGKKDKDKDDDDDDDEGEDEEEVLTFDDDAEFMQHVEEKSLTGFADKVTSFYDKTLSSMVASKDKAISSNVSLKVELSDDALELLSSLADMDLSWLKKAGLDYEVSLDGDVMGMVMGLSLGGTKIADIDAVIDFGEAMIYMSVPQILTKYVAMDMGTEMGVDFSMLEEMMSISTPALPEADVLSDMLERYIGIIVDNIETVESDEDTISIGDIEKDCTVLEFAVTEADLQNIALAIMEEAADDKDLEEVIVGFVDWMDEYSAMIDGYSYYDSDEIYSEFVESLEDAIDELEDVEADDEEVLLTLKDYVDEKNNVLGRAIIVDGEEIVFFGSVTDGSNCAFTLVAGEEVELLGEGTVKSNKFSGDAKLISYGDEYFAIEISDLDLGKLEDGYLSGTFNIKLGELLEEMGAGGVGANLLANYDLRLSIDTSAKGGKIELGLVDGNDYFVKVALESKEGKTSSVKVPGDYFMIDENADPEELVKYLDLDVLVDRLEDSPLPSEYVEIVEELAAQLG